MNLAHTSHLHFAGGIPDLWPPLLEILAFVLPRFHATFLMNRTLHGKLNTGLCISHHLSVELGSQYSIVALSELGSCRTDELSNCLLRNV
ncbi:hypothetical protein XENTR_v10015904 [Xenopus tropicalis]|nr:hypothetical protein XENTR_v10015904 [Xenopus tropicalis]